jgi:hypothetical protein
MAIGVVSMSLVAGRWSRRRLLTMTGSAALVPFGGCGSVSTTQDPPLASILGPARFSAGRVIDGLPEGWRPHVMRLDRRLTNYRVVRREGRQVLEATARQSTSGLRCDVDIDPLQTPWLQWGWRVDRFPDGATIADDERDDSPARIVLAFDGDHGTLGTRDRIFKDLVELLTGKALPFATLMYVWDGEAPLEKVIAYPRSGRIQYLVVESGAGGAGRWLSYRRNVRDDYRRVFGAEPGRIRHIGVLSDSDDLKVEVQSWFDDITFDAG